MTTRCFLNQLLILIDYYKTFLYGDTYDQTHHYAHSNISVEDYTLQD